VALPKFIMETNIDEDVLALYSSGAESQDENVNLLLDCAEGVEEIDESKSFAEQKKKELKERVDKFARDEKERVQSERLEEALKAQEKYSKLLLKPKRTIDEAAFDQAIYTKQYYPVKKLESSVKPSKEQINLGGWFSIGVLALNLRDRISKKGTKYCRWSLTDFSAHADDYFTVDVMLFDGAQLTWGQELEGGVFAIFNAEPLPKNKDFSYCMRVTSDHQICKIGNSRDFAFCTKVDPISGYRCRNFVNTSIARVCSFHIRKNIAKIQASRLSLQNFNIDSAAIKQKRLKMIQKQREENEVVKKNPKPTKVETSMLQQYLTSRTKKSADCMNQIDRQTEAERYKQSLLKEPAPKINLSSESRPTLTNPQLSSLSINNNTSHDATRTKVELSLDTDDDSQLYVPASLLALMKKKNDKKVENKEQGEKDFEDSNVSSCSAEQKTLTGHKRTSGSLPLGRTRQKELEDRYKEQQQQKKRIKTVERPTQLKIDFSLR